MAFKSQQSWAFLARAMAAKRKADNIPEITPEMVVAGAVALRDALIDEHYLSLVDAELLAGRVLAAALGKGADAARKPM